jgi:uncharacterized protein YhfF
VHEEFWSEFVAETGIDGPHAAFGFAEGASRDVVTRLARLVSSGTKRATTGIREPGEPPPDVGDLSIVLDGDGEPVCVIRTTRVETRRFGDVDEAFAFDEGEGDRTLAYWRAAHQRFFHSVGIPVDDATEVELEWFELLWPTGAGP